MRAFRLVFYIFHNLGSLHFYVNLYNMETAENTYVSKHISLQIRALKLSGFYFFIPHCPKSCKFWMIVLRRSVFGFFIFIMPSMGQFLYFVKLVNSGNYEVQEAAGM